MNNKIILNQGEWFIIAPSIDNEGITYKDGQFSQSQNETTINPIKEIQEDMKVLEKYWGGSKIINGMIDESNLIIYDAANVKEPTSSSYKKRLNFVFKVSCVIDILGLENVQTLQIYYIGNNQAEIPKWLEYAKQNGYKGIMILRDLPFGQVEPIKMG